MIYRSAQRDELIKLKEELMSRYEEYKNLGLRLDMSRGKPGATQIELSKAMLDEVNSSSDCTSGEGIDCCNYGHPDGIREMRELLGALMEVSASNVIVGGNSSLNMMFDTVTCFMTHGIGGCLPWLKQGKVKFLCPSPGYDRHFAILSYYGVEQIVIPMQKTGPDMDKIERLVSTDESIKGIWCVPKYSNPGGVTYSDKTVKRFSALKPKAKDFRIFWDNAYAVHGIYDGDESLLSVMDECKKNGTEDLPIIFTSTSKITFAGGGVAGLGASDLNLKALRERYAVQTIGSDKINQLRHARFLRSVEGIREHMEKQKPILRERFEAVLSCLEREFTNGETVSWSVPNGGYFISVDILDGGAKRVTELCKTAGLVITQAGATYPHGKDPDDRNIRIAPSYPTVDDLNKAMELFCICIKLAILEKQTGEDMV